MDVLKEHSDNQSRRACEAYEVLSTLVDLKQALEDRGHSLVVLSIRLMDQGIAGAEAVAERGQAIVSEASLLGQSIEEARKAISALRRR